MVRPWHEETADAVLAMLATSAQGLAGSEARERLGSYGPNELRETRHRSVVRMFLGQFSDVMILVLIGAAAVAGIVGEASDAIAIIVILVLNAILGFAQEYRAERAMAALKGMAASRATALRDGRPIVIPASGLVPGDIALLEAGNIVPADLRILDAARLTVDEAALTGESVPAEKTVAALAGEAIPLGDRKNMLYKGTSVSYGRATGVVVATGMDTELGRIAGMLQEQEEGRTPLQKRLAHFGGRIAAAILVICAIVFLTGLLRGEPAVNIFLVAVSLAVAAIPEALPAVVTISLALGARKMVRQNALVRKLPAVETLGSVTYICTDKTGTLTVNRMAVEELWVDGKVEKRQGDRGAGEGNDAVARPQEGGSDPRRVFFTALALSNDSRADASGTAIGDPTEAALFAAAGEKGFVKAELERSHPRVAELPFDSERKLMTTFHRWEDRGPGAVPAGPLISFTKGAVEEVLGRSTALLTAAGIRPLDREALERVSERIAADGLRVLAVAMRSWRALPSPVDPGVAERDLVLLGLLGLMDPPREEAGRAVRECRSAGITPVMITGDHPFTARAIARRVGILDNDDPAAVITGRELGALSLADFEERVTSIRVYARVAPEQKLKIVRALQDKGHFVAMTGDGVNDAPALKKADIGVAMGVTGTDVAKEASSMILLDDNFATIVQAVKAGRQIYDNLRKVVRYLLSSNSGEIWTLFLAPFFGLPVPLQPIHILWINLMTDSLPALALAVEPGEENVMSRPPRHPRENLFAGGLGVYTIWVGLLMAAITLGTEAWAIHIGDSHWQTMVFTTLCFLQLGNVLAIRSERTSLLRKGLFSNPSMVGCIVLTVALQLATVYVPALNPVFRTVPLGVGELAAVLGLSTVVLIAAETEKWFKRRSAAR